MKGSRQRVLIVVVLVVLGLGVGTVSWWLLGRQVPPDEGRSAPAQTSSRHALEQASTELATTGEIGRLDSSPAPPGIEDIIDIDGIVEQERISTAEDLVRKGLPLIPTWRKEIIESVANMSLEGVANDLDNTPVRELCRNQNVSGSGSGMLFWASALPPNMMILRLIEEGREDPDRVCDVLEEVIARKIEQLAEICEKEKNPPYYRPWESEPTQFAITAAFYVLANIDRLNNPALLERWFVAPQPLGLELGSMKYWFIDYYFRLTDAAGSPHAAAHLAIANGRVVAGPRLVLSKWDQPWDVNDPMLALAGVNVRDLKTIEVLTIPAERPFTLDQSIRIKENFDEHVRQLADGD